MTWIKKNIERIGFVAIILLLLYTCSDNKNKLSTLIYQQSDSIARYKDQTGNLVAEKASIQASFSELKKSHFLLQGEKSELEKRLLAKVDKKTHAAISFDDQISIHDSTNLITTYDTIRGVVDSSARLISMQNEWINLKVNSTPMKSILDLSIRNKYDITFDYQRTGFLKLGKPIYKAKITALNPYTQVNDMASYVDVPLQKKNHTGLKILGGFIAGSLTATYLLTR